jgi:hypothetical protein
VTETIGSFDLCVRTFGATGDPAILLIGGSGQIPVPTVVPAVLGICGG